MGLRKAKIRIREKNRKEKGPKTGQKDFSRLDIFPFVKEEETRGKEMEMRATRKREIVKKNTEKNRE